MDSLYRNIGFMRMSITWVLPYKFARMGYLVRVLHYSLHELEIIHI